MGAIPTLKSFGKVLRKWPVKLKLEGRLPPMGRSLGGGQGSIKVGTLGTAFLDNLKKFRQSVTETTTKSDHNLVKSSDS